MKRILISSLIAVVVLAAVGHAARGADDGWKIPSLNPFTSSSKPRVTARVSDAPTSGWHMPKLWPAQSNSKPKPQQPSSWQKMTTGTKDMLSKTASALNPWDEPKDKAPPKITGSNSIFSQAAHKKKKQQEEKSSSWLPSSWWGGEQSKQPQTVTGFLAQPRPQ